MAKIDLDSREVRELKRNGGGQWLPRARALYKAQLLSFEDFETDNQNGQEIKLRILKAQARGKQHRDFEPIAERDDEVTFQFKRVHNYPSNKMAALQDERVFIAACMGEDPSDEDFSANSGMIALRKLSDRGKLEDLDPLWIEVDAYPGTQPNAETGKYYINTRLVTHPSEWDPRECTLGPVVAGKARPAPNDDDEDEDDAPPPKRAAKKAPVKKRPTVDEDDDEDDDDAPPPKRGAKAAVKKPAAKPRRIAADEDDDDEEPAPKKKPARR